jgi:predicted CoA-binding protein
MLKPESTMGVRQLIDDFFSLKRFALVGVSGDPKDFSRTLMREFIGRGYNPVPVNPNHAEIEGQPSAARIMNVDPKIEAALIMTGPKAALKVLDDCKSAGIRLVWLYRSVGKGALSAEALEFCKENQISVIPGYCPFMFFPNTGFIHRFHRFFMKIKGSYPR